MCVWFQDFQRCKFQKCANRHEREQNLRKDVEILNYKIRKLEGLIKEKEAQNAD